MQTIISTEGSRLRTVCPEWLESYDYNCFDVDLNVRPPILIRGEEIPQPRDVGFYSDVSEGYYYSRRLMKSKPMTEEMNFLLGDVNDYLGAEFNGLLINRYATGLEYIGPHSDSLTGLCNGVVATVSFGGERKFRIRATKPIVVTIGGIEKSFSTGDIVKDIVVTNGMLLTMEGNFQDEFTHEVPKTAKKVEPRISVTFRKHAK